MRDITHKIAQFFRSDDYFKNGEDATLSFTPAELREIASILSENARLKSSARIQIGMNYCPYCGMETASMKINGGMEQ